MILDTSAVIAILQLEQEAPQFAQAVQNNRPVRISAANWLESAVVVDGNRSPGLSLRFDQFMHDAGVEIEPVTRRQAQLAREAYRAYGRGNGHSARLNFGDCFAYALAMDRDEELLFKGNDFRGTDVRSVQPV